MGETLADHINETLGFGLTNTTVAFVAALIVVLAVQFRLRRYAWTPGNAVLPPAARANLGDYSALPKGVTDRDRTEGLSPAPAPEDRYRPAGPR